MRVRVTGLTDRLEGDQVTRLTANWPGKTPGSCVLVRTGLDSVQHRITTGL